MTKTTRSLPSQRAAHVADRVPDAVRKAFAAYSRSELLSLRERNVNMLRRRYASAVASLPAAYALIIYLL